MEVNNPHYKMINGCIAAGIELYPPYTTFENGRYKGICLDMFSKLASVLGLCFTLIRSEDKIFGSQMPNGSWTGLIGLLERHEVEIAVCPVVRNYPRYQVIDFSEPVLSTHYSILYKSPHVGIKIFQMFQPFPTMVWYTFFSCVAILTFCAIIWRRVTWSQREERLKPHCMKNRDLTLYGFIHCVFQSTYQLNLLWIYQALVSQPITNFQNIMGGRTFASLWLSTVCVISIMYSSNLKSLLIAPIIEIPFNSLEELVQQEEIGWTFLNNSVIELYFKPAYMDNPFSIMGQAWRKKSELYQHPDDAGKYILEKNLAGIIIEDKAMRTIADDFSKTGSCRLSLADHAIITSDMTFGLYKRSTLADVINPLISRLKETGILSKMFSKGLRNATHCLKSVIGNSSNANVPLSLYNLSGVFSIWVTGIGFAIIVFLTELWINKKVKTNGNSRILKERLPAKRKLPLPRQKNNRKVWKKYFRDSVCMQPKTLIY